MDQQIESLLSAAISGAKYYREEQIRVLEKLVSIDCGTGDEAGNKQVVGIVDGLLGYLDGIDIEHRYFPGYGEHIVARIRPQKPSGKIILNAHMDTVFHSGDVRKYPMRIENDILYGLGAADCKGGILVSIYAVKILQENGLLPDKEIVFIFNCDEEAGSPTAHQVFDEEMKGTDMAFVFEPARLENGVLTARKGAIHISVDVRGKKAHAGINYLDGRSAAVELAYKILKFYQANDDENGIQFNPAKLYSGEYGIGVVADYASAEIGVRVRNSEDIERVKEIVRQIEKDIFVPGTSTAIKMKVKSVPMERNINNIKLYQKVYEAGRLLGMELPEQATGGSGDAGYFSFNGIPTVDALGPYMYRVHSTDEAIRLSSLEEKTRLFCLTLGMMV